MFYYPPTSGFERVWCIARIADDRIGTDERGIWVRIWDVNARAGITFGGWERALDWARTEAKRVGETRYVLPCTVGYASNGGAIAHLVSGSLRFGIDSEGRNVPVPRFTS